MRTMLFKYLKQYRYIACMLIIFTIIFAGIFSLYSLQEEAVLYAFALCALLGLLVLVANFYKFYKKYTALNYIEKNIVLMCEQLPAYSSPLEEQYQLMLRSLCEIYCNKMRNWQEMRTESIDYYTTWVHQVKSPIAVMRIVLQGEDTEKNKELLSELFRIEQYTDMVLCYFRLDSISSDFVIKQYKLDNIIRQVIRKFAPLFVRKKIGVSYNATNAHAITDEKWLGFILEQLLTNAIKYTEKGEITVAVSDDNVLSISDTGIGIAESDLPRIFEKGFTGYNGRADKKATGLGLYLCKQAADKLSHKISVSSYVKKGSVFYIDLNREAIFIE